MKNKDITIIVIILIIAIILGLVYNSVIYRQTAPSDSVVIYIDENIYRTIALDGVEQDIQIDQDDGSVNIIHITKNGAYMSYSSCKNQSCIKQGEVNISNHTSRGMGDWIICLPNKVSIELIEGENH